MEGLAQPSSKVPCSRYSIREQKEASTLKKYFPYWFKANANANIRECITVTMVSTDDDHTIKKQFFYDTFISFFPNSYIL